MFRPLSAIHHSTAHHSTSHYSTSHYSTIVNPVGERYRVAIGNDLNLEISGRTVSGEYQAGVWEALSFGREKRGDRPGKSHSYLSRTQEKYLRSINLEDIMKID